MREVRIYFEGDDALRRGFSGLFENVRAEARSHGLGFRFIAGKSTREALEDFAQAVQTHPDALVLALVDTEAPVPAGQTAKGFLAQRFSGALLAHAREDQLHLMVQLMESWFLADKETLAAYYGQGFHQASLAANQNVEEIAKEDVLRGLQQATEPTQKGPYHKTKHAPDLLEKLDAQRVRQAAPHCNRLFEVLEQAIAGACQ